MYKINIFFASNQFEYESTKFNLCTDFSYLAIINNNIEIQKDDNPFSKVNYGLANYSKNLNIFFHSLRYLGVICINMDYLNFRINIL